MINKDDQKVVQNGIVMGLWKAANVRKKKETFTSTVLHEKHRQMGRQTYMMPQIDEYSSYKDFKCWVIENLKAHIMCLSDA